MGIRSRTRDIPTPAPAGDRDPHTGGFRGTGWPVPEHGQQDAEPGDHPEAGEEDAGGVRVPDVQRLLHRPLPCLRL